ncbi:glyoxylate reductase [Microdochium nivale]|nr:glyoxylate reductase [Microdochium nivale]
MAEPTNTPLPTAPGTPISATPRSASPTHHHPAGAALFQHPPVPSFAWPASALSSRNVSVDYGPPVAGLDAILAGRSTGSSTAASKPIVLHLGDPVHFNPATYAAFTQLFHVVRPSTEERSRDAFAAALRERRWGEFSAVFRPFWSTGGEMGNWDRELVSLLPLSVRVFASAGAGFDWVDTRALGERGVIYCNGSLAAAESVAEFAVAMIISTFRMLPYCMSAAATTSSFHECHVGAPAKSHTLRGKTLGIVGLGNIGQAIARKCSLAFGMRVCYHDIEQKSAALEAELSARFCSTLKDLVSQSDCVVLAIPSATAADTNNNNNNDNKTLQATTTVINAEILTSFPRGSRFVNVARGNLVDEDALADALDSGHLSNIALDVHADETRGVSSTRLAAYAGTRAMLTCHNAGGTVETHAGFEELAMRNIMDVLGSGGGGGGSGKGLTPVNLHFLTRKDGE